MQIKEINGNLLDSNAELILHQVNCMGAMNSGVAKAIREKWPVVYIEYMKLVNNSIYGSEKSINREKLLGCIQPVKINDNQSVVNLFGQLRYGYDGKQYTKYEAITHCLCNVAIYCKENNIKTIALPWKMSCGRGGGDWETVLGIIKAAFIDVDVTVEIWKLE